jgi:hypothetical protein
MKPRNMWPWMMLVIGTAVGIGLFFGLRILFVLLQISYGLSWPQAVTNVHLPFDRFAWGWQLFTVFIWGLLGLRNHPVGIPKYRAWLETTPWHSGKPLPMGGVHVRLSEWIVLAIWTTVGALTLDVKVLHLPAAFLAGYLLMAMRVLYQTEQEGATLLLAFGLAGMVRLWNEQVACLVLSLVLYAIAYFGLRSSLASFPWAKEEKPLVEDFGWPLSQLGPKRKEHEIGFFNAVAVALLVALWMHAGMSHLAEAKWDDDMRVRGAIIGACVGAIAGLIRLSVYLAGLTGPIDLRGRIATGRLIIPSHDSAWWAAASLPIIAAAAGHLFLDRLGLRFDQAAPATLFVLLLAAMVMPPSRRRYQLTGEHRMVEHRPSPPWVGDE